MVGLARFAVAEERADVGLGLRHQDRNVAVGAQADVAAQAASDAVVEYRHERDLTAACAVAQATIAADQPDLKLGKNFCTGDPEAVAITITIRTTAHTFALGRLDFTKHYTNITQTETAGESAV